MPVSISDIIIPQNPLPVTDNQKLIINTFGLGNVKTLVLSQTIGKRVAYILEEFQKTDFENKINGYTSTTQYDYVSNSEFFKGVPIFDVFKFQNQNYIDVTDGNKTKTALEFEIQNCLLSINQTKNIVTTSIQGRKGTVKEYISDGDLQINVKCVLNARNGEVPTEQVKTLLTNLTANTSLPITNKVLNEYFQCYNVVVTDFTHPQQIGSLSSWQFEFNCLSDYPVELFLSR
jgi:hypothetical protein